MRRPLTALSVLALLLGGCAESPDRQVFDPAATNVTAAQAADRYIVVLNRAPDGSVVAVNALAATIGVTPDLVYQHALAGFAAELTPAQVAALEANPQVAFVEQDQIMRTTGTQSPTPSWGLDRIDQANLPLDNSYTYPNSGGAGVHFYGIDTGILGTHNDFSGRMGNGANFVSSGGGTTDCNGHGTHTASTAGGTTYGVAKSVTIHPVRVLDCGGSGFTSWVIGGVDWVRQNAQFPAVANMSLGGGASSALDQAVADAVNAGIVFSVSAGNSTTNACLQSPAREPSAITVASTTITDQRSSFSNFGTCVDLFAPGSSIVAAYIGSNSATATLSGTSMAAPHVAGVAALHLGITPSATPGAVTNAITSNATSGVVGNPGSGSPNLLLNMSYLNGAPPPPPPSGETLTIVAEDATTATLEVVFGDGDGDGQPPNVIGFRSGPTSSDPPAKANGQNACPPLFSPTSPAQTVCQKDNSSQVTVYAVVEGDGPERAIGPETLPVAGGTSPPPPPPPPPPTETLTIVAMDASTVTVELVYDASTADPGEAIGARGGSTTSSPPVCPPFSTPSNPQPSPATTVCQRGASDYTVWGVIEEGGGVARGIGPVTVPATTIQH